MILTGSIKDMIAGKFNGELIIIVAGSGIPRSRYKHLLESGEDIRHMARFAPSRNLLKQYKVDGNIISYREWFVNEMVSNGKIEQLQSIVDESKIPVRLVCHEPEGEFCHRHILKGLINDKPVKTFDWNVEPMEFPELDNETLDTVYAQRAKKKRYDRLYMQKRRRM